MSNDYEKKRSALTVSTASIDAYSDELKRIENKNDVQPMKGWMKKKSPALLKGWQKRYFMLIENMQEGPWKLVYFDNDKTDTKPNGAFDLSSITSINQISKKEFTIQFPGRNLELKVKTPELCQQWIATLNGLRTATSPQRTKRQVSMDSVVKMADESPTKLQNHKIVDTYTAQQAQVYKERQRNSLLIDLSKGDKKIKEKQNTQQLSNEKMLELIGLKEFIKNMNEQFVYQRMIYGYLGKRSKGKVKYFQKRWFILVSAKPLYSDYNDEKILQESQLPPWLELDTITYFKQKEEGKPPKAKGDVKMLDCQEIIIKNMSKSKESGYTFKLNMGDRLYHLMADSELERTKWQTALSASIRITKEINNPLKIKIKKNIDPLIQLYDEETQLIARREKIRQKLEQDIAAILKEEDVDLNKLISQLTDLRQDMLESMQASIVKDPQRKDIVKEYTDIYHEKICERITKFWDQNYMKLQSPELLLIGQWLHDYLLQMKDFFNDDRILLGVGVLLNIYVNRSLESMESVIYQIIEQERIQEPFLNDQEQLVTQTPVDLFKIINEGFDMAYKLCSCKETVIRFGGFGKVILQQYQGGIQEIIDEYQLSVAKFVAICNNTLALHDNTKQYSKRLQSFGNLSDEEVEKVFDGQKITKNFVQIASNCRERIFIFYFSRVGTHFKKPYLEIKIIDTLKSIIEPATEALSQLHDSFSRKLWKQLTDSIILYYFNQFIISCSKAKKEQQNEFIRKLENDKEILYQELETFIFEKQLQATLKPFDDMISFLNEESLSILDPCKSLRQYFGRAFSEKTIKSIMTLRFDLDKEQKKDTIEICKNLIEDINKTQPIEEDTVRIMDFLGQEDEEQNSTQMQQQEQVQRRADIRLDFNDNEIQSIPQQQQKRTSIEKEEFIDEGYLYKKKPKSKAWDYRFVRIRKGFMYWYINSNSREAQNKINLQSVDEVIPNPKKSTNFKIQLEDSKIYKFKTQTKEECELWIKTILKEQNQTEVAIITLEAIQIGNGKLPIIKDYDEIARKERQRQKQEERKRKRIEKENELKKKQMELKLLQQQQLKELGDKPQPHQVVDVFEQQRKSGDSSKKTTSCWTSFLIALGVERPK
ncbi:unnamed protein product (macronuclear) [Paramecium tetraurelia]|uniref:PH domain-containing protein n=1 Tax=Paramecium tetraurelia TaxID=5888 RepID=A0BH07_PARTE|nr:uncharacterized protein GSPATT00028859001 [Paramecium tetraurelia]CAK57824.1 unnamed protein product [Paramecium tetraurelia]|eukprot:XP_001425222.1 hypothetical protein (macronuclear) [Paramecium tetraurelia strain d4-2]